MIYKVISRCFWKLNLNNKIFNDFLFFSACYRFAQTVAVWILIYRKTDKIVLGQHEMMQTFLANLQTSERTNQHTSEIRLSTINSKTELNEAECEFGNEQSFHGPNKLSYQCVSRGWHETDVQKMTVVDLLKPLNFLSLLQNTTYLLFVSVMKYLSKQ